ncbi:MAG: hypothetical protein VX321_07850, partial [Actinomycetota bacterium]|nr:hypothetical protein [Actinomycetota bacterium]
MHPSTIHPKRDRRCRQHPSAVDPDRTAAVIEEFGRHRIGMNRRRGGWGQHPRPRRGIGRRGIDSADLPHPTRQG